MHMTMMFGGLTLAQAAAPGGNPMVMIGYMVIIFGLFYFLMIRPQMKKEKERKKMIAAVKTGDRVLFCGGMLGTVANVKEGLLVIKIADNVKVEVARGAVYRALDKDEAPGEDVERK